MLRIKAMQTIYHHEIDDSLKLTQLVKLLHGNLNELYNHYIFSLHMLREIMEYANTDAAIRSEKHLPTQDDKSVNTRLAGNWAFEKLLENEVINERIEDKKLGFSVDNDVVRNVFNKLKFTSQYKEYILDKEGMSIADKSIVKYLYKKVMLKNELYKQLIEDSFPASLDNNETVIKGVLKTLDSLDEKNEFEVPTLDEDEIESLAEALLDRYLESNEELGEILQPRLANWDAERVAKIDMIILKMAVSELLYFPSIPIKVTINEYIDISKIYSTPKSKEFVNGVLDKTMHELQVEGKIKKTGRGLVN